MAELQTYRANIEYSDAELKVGRGLDITFLAEGSVDAARAVKRFWESREKALPGYFGKLLCVQIMAYAIGTIGDDGELNSRAGLKFFEWKVDMGWTYEERVSYLEELLKRKTP